MTHSLYQTDIISSQICAGRQFQRGIAITFQRDDERANRLLVFQPRDGGNWCRPSAVVAGHRHLLAFVHRYIDRMLFDYRSTYRQINEFIFTECNKSIKKKRAESLKITHERKNRQSIATQAALSKNFARHSQKKGLR